jgi:hypothetical protein
MTAAGLPLRDGAALDGVALDGAALDGALLDAHARGDRAALVGLYAEAADRADEARAAAFFLTQAYVFALETGDARAPALRARLVELGSERDAAAQFSAAEAPSASAIAGRMRLSSTSGVIGPAKRSTTVPSPSMT